MKKRDEKKYIKRIMNFVIECPKPVQEDMALDKNNGNTLWADDIAKELRYVQAAFDIR